MKKAAAVAVGLAVPAGAVLSTTAGACRQPTEMVVHVATDVPCGSVMGAAVAVGSPDDYESAQPKSRSTFCDPATGDLGNVVVVPGSSQGEVAIRVVGGVGQSVDRCVPPDYDGGCIVARRALDFVDHARLEIFVQLQQACLGRSCDPTSTCYAGQCIPVGDVTADGGLVDAAVLDGGPGMDASAILAACGDRTGLAPGAQWAMEGFCNSGQWRCPYVGTTGDAAVQLLSTSDEVGSSAAIGEDGTIYVPVGLGAGSNQTTGTLYALDADGGVKWSLSTNGALRSAPTLAADGRLYFTVVGRGVVSALFDGGGTTASPPYNGGSHGPAVGPDGHLYATSPSFALALSPGLGSAFWTEAISSGDDLFTPLSLDASALLTGAGGTVYSLATATGTQTASVQASMIGSVVALARGSDDAVYVATDNPAAPIFAFDSPAKLPWSLRWSRNSTCGRPATAIALGPADLVLFGTPCGIEAHDPATGALVWAAPPAQVAGAGMIVDGAGKVYVGDAFGDMYALDSQNKGAVLWESTLSPGNAVRPLAMDRSGAVVVAISSAKNQPNVVVVIPP